MFYNSNKCPDTQYLEWELERERESNRRMQEEQDRQREERIKARNDEREFYRRTAKTWPEALQKQASLCRAEAAYFIEGDPDYPDDFFGPCADACDRAREIWKEVEASKQAKIEALQKQLAAVQDEIRLEVARQLASENKDNTSGWRHTAAVIERNENLDNWLNW